MPDILSVSLQDILYSWQSELRTGKIIRCFLKQRLVSLLIIRLE